MIRILAPLGLALGLLLAMPAPARAQDLGGIVGQALEGLTGRPDDRREERRFEEDRGRGAERRQELRERERALERRERAEERRRWEEEQRRRARAERRREERDRY